MLFEIAAALAAFDEPIVREGLYVNSDCSI